MLKRYIKKNKLGVVKKEYFRNITTMKVGGKIRYYYSPNSITSLKKVVEYLENKKIKYIFIGNGSNLIASEKTFNGVVINSRLLPKTLSLDNNVLKVTAFYDLRRLVSFCVSKDIDIFTNLAGIPATLGGALYMNASANGMSISDDLHSVTYLENNKIISKLKEELTFNYRESSFQNKNIIILEAKFYIKFRENILKDYNEYLKQRKLNHPLIFPNSGSIFRNIGNTKAYQIIRDLELQGKMKGKAQVSIKHSNFIINTGRAKGSDVYKLIKLIKKKAMSNNIYLKEEVILFNFKKETK